MTKARKMSAPRRRYGGPSAQLPGSVVEALVSKDRLPRALENAWWRIIRAFASAETKNFIEKCEESVSSLAKRIMEKMSDEARDAIFSADKLPDGYGLHLKGKPTDVVDRIVYDLIVQQLVVMRDHKRRYAWYQSGGWCLLSTASDHYDKSTRRVIPNPRGRSDYARSTGKGAMVRRPPQVIIDEIMAAGTAS